MKILVALKQVAARDSLPRIAASGRWVDEADLAFEINEPDAYTLEEALGLKEKHGGEVVVLSAGPPRAAQAIREALAKGADRAIHIQEEHLENWDTLGIASLIARAIETEKPDLVLTGLQSDDLGYGQTGVVSAELAGLPHATIIMQVEVMDGHLRAKRELEDGWFQWIELPIPALLTIQSGIRKLRYATLMGIKKAKTKPFQTLTPADLGVTAAPALEIAHVCAAKVQANGNPGWQPGRSCGQTGGTAQIHCEGVMRPVLAILEQRDGVWHRMSWETLAAAQQLGRELGEPVSAAVSGSNVSSLAGEAARYNLDRVYVVEHPLLGRYTADTQTAALEGLIKRIAPRLVLVPHTYQARDFAPKLAARFRRVLASDSIGHRVDNGEVFCVRQLFQGKLNAEVRFATGAPISPRSKLAPIVPILWKPVPQRSEVLQPDSISGDSAPAAGGAVPGSANRCRFDLRAANRSRWARNQGEGEHRRCRGTRGRARGGVGRIAAPFAITAGCRWSGRSEAPVRRWRRSFTLPSEFPARSSSSQLGTSIL